MPQTWRVPYLQEVSGDPQSDFLRRPGRMIAAPCYRRLLMAMGDLTDGTTRVHGIVVREPPDAAVMGVGEKMVKRNFATPRKPQFYLGFRG